MAKQLFILFVVFGINSAMNFPEEQNSQIQASDGDSVVATDMLCNDEGCH